MAPGTAAGRVVILDRDGTIVVDRGYLDDPGGLEFLPGAAAGLRRLQQCGCRLVVISNQSGVGRGLISPDRLAEINRVLERMVQRAGARLEGIYCCPHAPEEHCACRKPRPGLLLRAARELDFEPARAIVVGDKPSDVGLGQACGAATVFLGEPEEAPADHYARDLLEAAELIVTRLMGASTGLGAAAV